MQLLYTIFIEVYGWILTIASLFHPKAKLWVNGRKKWEEKLGHKISSIDQVIWMHCSSLGEFEQGRPVLEALREEYPNHTLALSFFSPSGYEVRKNYQGADYIFYLPLDSPKNMRRLVELLHPEMLILVKYEYWYNMIEALDKKKVPIYVISAIFRKQQNFFWFDGKNWFAKQLRKITHFFVQNEESKQLLQHIYIDQVTISGDTRFDRVKNLLSENFDDEKILHFKNQHHLIVVGSSWPKDEELFLNYFTQNPLPGNWRLLFAPHEVDEKSIENLQQKFPEAVRYSSYQKEETSSSILLVDTIGLLNKIYALADIVYIGGGFGAGIHNTLEAATYGKPIIIGPKYQKFQEAVDQIENKNMISIRNQKQFDKILRKLMTDSALRNQMGIISRNYISNQPLATKIILQKLREMQ